MDKTNIFVSVGVTSTAEQEQFVSAIENRLTSEGLVPKTVGRNTFSAGAPMKMVEELLDTCAGTVVIALERYYYPSGTEKRGSADEISHEKIKLPTPWNQIEAALSYSRGLPLLVIVEKGIKSEGLLERNYDWYVQYVPINEASLQSAEFNGVLSSWIQRIEDAKRQKKMDADKHQQQMEAEIAEEVLKRRAFQGRTTKAPSGVTSSGLMINNLKIYVIIMALTLLILLGYKVGRLFPDIGIIDIIYKYVL